MKSKFLTSVATALTLAIGVSALTPQKANAYILIDQTIGVGMTTDLLYLGLLEGDTESVLVAVGCVLLLPLCLLDQKSTSSAAVTTADLAANGYSADEIKQIQKDQSILLQNLKLDHAKLIIRDTDTKASIEQDIRSMNPTVSQTYLDFATASMNLK